MIPKNQPQPPEVPQAGQVKQEPVLTVSDPQTEQRGVDEALILSSSFLAFAGSVLA